MIGSDKRGLGRREGNGVVAVREDAVDAQWTCQADRDLNRANEIFNIALEAGDLLNSLGIHERRLVLCVIGDDAPADRAIFHQGFSAERDTSGEMITIWREPLVLTMLINRHRFPPGIACV